MKKIILFNMFIVLGLTSNTMLLNAATTRSTIHDCSSVACNWTSAGSFHSYVMRYTVDGGRNVRASASNYESSSNFRVEAAAGASSEAKSGNGVTASASCGMIDTGCTPSSTGNAIFGI